MIKGIDVAFIHTDKMNDLRDCYRENLGLDVVYGDGHWEEFGMSSGSRFAPDGIVSSTPSPVVQQAIMISFAVDDIHAAMNKLAARGVEFYPSVDKTIFNVGPTLVATFRGGAGN